MQKRHFSHLCANRLHNNAVPLHRETKSLTFKRKETLMWFDDEDYRHDDFEGTYAHDYEGFDDETIYDAFEGDPDAYWNID